MLRAVARFLNPVSREKRALLRRRWEQLPAELRDPRQVVGRQLVHCAYTMGPSYCSMGCTHCYLPKNANRIPLPSFEEMKEQIDANRRMIGEAGGLQLTGGDVVEAYFRAGRGDELIRLTRYANDRGVVPMIMTHGQTLLSHPSYLDRLIVEGGLRKLAIHVDTTQAGRPGFRPDGRGDEAVLHPLREAFVDLILGASRRTGVRITAAHTVTVGRRNLATVPEILRWLLSNPRHLRAFRMVSFQTEAQVGRTLMSEAPVRPDEVWKAICDGAGLVLPRDGIYLGHPDCSSMSTLMVLYDEGRVVNLLDSDEESQAFWGAVLDGFGGVGSRGEHPLEETLQRAGLLLRRPSLAVTMLRYAVRRARREGLRPRWLWQAARGRVGFLNIVMHNFMSEAELTVPRSDRVRKRLEACAFRGAVRRDGEWVAVPMCFMNVEERERLYASRIPGPGGVDLENSDQPLARYSAFLRLPRTRARRVSRRAVNSDS